MSLFLDAFASAMAGCDGLSALLLALTTAPNPLQDGSWGWGGGGAAKIFGLKANVSAFPVGAGVC